MSKQSKLSQIRSETVTVVTLNNPFSMNDRTIRPVEYIPVKTLAGYVKDAAAKFEDQEFAVSVNGHLVPADQWAITTVKPGSYLAICPVVAGGGDDGGKSILGIIAGIALSVLTMGVGSAVSGGAFWGSQALAMSAWTFGGFLAATAVMFLGGMLISHMMPQPKADTDFSQSSPTYSWQKTQPLQGQGYPLGILYGTAKPAPVILSQHVSSDGDKQYLNVLLCVGDGPIDEITDITINDNPVANYDDTIIVETRMGTNDQTSIQNFGDTFVDQSLNYELTLANGWATQLADGSAAQGIEVQIELPAGLYHANNDGSLGKAYVDIQAEYRLAGGSWAPFVVGTPVYRNSVYISDGEGGETFDHYEYSTTPGRDAVLQIYGRIEAAQSNAVRRTYRIDNLAPGRYEVHVKCVAKSGETTRDATRVFWTMLSQILYEDFSRPGKALIAIKALATEQLSGGIPNISCLVTRSNVWVWDPSANNGAGGYVQKPATNPAWASYDLIHRCKKLRDIRTSEDVYVAFGAPKERIYFQEFADWAQFCTDKGLEINYFLDKAADLWTALRDIEGVGRGKVVMKGTRYGAICDRPADPVQMFTVGNIIRDSFQEEFLALKDRANAIEVTFTNKDKGYQRDVLVVYGDDWDTSDVIQNPTQISLDGIVTVEQAYREAKYRLRLNKYLLRTCSFEAATDAIACQVGDVILVQHDVPQWGYGGRIKGVTRTRPATNVYTGDSESGGLSTDYGPQGTTYSWSTDYAFYGSKSVKLVVGTNGNIYASGAGVKFTTTASNDWTSSFVVRRADGAPVTGLSVYIYSANAANTYIAATITPISDGWYLVKATKHQATAGAITLTGLYNFAPNITYYIDGIQVEPQATYTPDVDTLTMDQEVEMEADTPYSVLVRLSETDEIIQKDIAAAVDYRKTDQITVATPFADLPEEFDVYSFGQVDVEAKPFRVVSITRAADMTRRITAIEYVEAVYDEAIDIPVVNYSALDPVTEATNLSVSQETYKQPDGTVVSVLYAGWGLPRGKSVTTFKVFYSKDDGQTWIFVNEIITDRIKITGGINAKETYKVRVCTVNDLGIVSPGVTSSGVYVTGWDQPPADVTGFAAAVDTTNSTRILLSWTGNTDPDLRGYEIREGTSWIGGTPVDKGIITTSYVYAATEERTYRFMIKAVDNSGNPSTNEAVASATPDVYPDDVAGFTVAPSATDKTRLELAWTATTNQDLAGYEIREGASWAAGTPIVKNLKANSFTYQMPIAGAYTFHIKAINSVGNYSQNSASAGGATYSFVPTTPGTGTITPDPLDRTVLTVSWGAVADSDLKEYEVRRGSVWASGAPVAVTKETSAKYTAQSSDISGDWSFMVQAKNASTNVSSVRSITATVNLEPSNVSGLTASQFATDKSKIRIQWNAVDDKDVACYELREGGPTWDQATVIQRNITGTFLDVIIASQPSFVYWIAAINKGNRYSATPAASPTYTFSLAPTTPTGLSVVTDPNDKTKAIITWNGIADQDLLEYQLVHGINFADGTVIAITKETRISWSPPSSIGYTIRLKAKNLAAGMSAEATTPYTAYIEPANVTGLAAAQNGENVLLTWQKVNEADVVGYEIREGGNYDNGTLIATGITGTTYQFPASTEVTRRFHVKAINRAGKQSQQAASANVTIANLLPKNVIANFDEIALQTGAKTAVEFGQSLLTFASLGGSFADYPTTKFSDIGGQTVLKLANLSIIEDGSFITGVADPARWLPIAGSGQSITGGVYRLTAATTGTRGVYYDFLDTLDRNGVYVVEFEARASKALTLTDGFTTQGGAYASAGATPTAVALSLTTSWQTFRREVTITSAGTEPGKYLLHYGAYTAGDWSEVKWFRIYKKTDEPKFTTGIWGEAFQLSGEYAAVQKDMGKLITANIAVDFNTSVLTSSGGSASLIYRTSRDGIIWDDWKTFVPVQATFRYLEMKAQLATTDARKTPEVNSFKIKIDVPDTDKAGSATILVGGTTVNYGYTYYATPAFIPMATEAGKRAVLTGAPGLSSAIVKVVDAITGADVGGSIIWISRGY